MVVAAHVHGRPTGAVGPRVIDAVREFAPLYLQRPRLTARVRSTLEVLLSCRTAARGGFRYECEDCGYSATLYGSCGSRYCSQCQGPRRRQWVEAKQQLLLPVPHHQVVATLPSELRPLARRFPSEIFDLLFKANHEMLQRFAGTRWGATPAILSVLHTWARDLSFHPHVHSVVSAGGLTDDGAWVWTRGRFLFPVRAMSAVFRGIFLSRLTALRLPLEPRERAALRIARSRAARKSWVVYVEAAKDRDPQHLVKYLARYLYQSAISDHRVLEVTPNTIRIRTRDTSEVTLSGEEFIRRLAQHILPKGYRRVRQYGLLAPGARRQLDHARDLLTNATSRAATPPRRAPAPPTPDPVTSFGPLHPCPLCGAPLRVYALAPVAVPVPVSPLARGPP
jgi:Putative transposase/Transposase zinc-binding domain